MVGTRPRAKGSAPSSNLPKRHAPLDWHPVNCLDHAVQFQHIGSGCNPEMRRDIQRGVNDADAFRGTTDREAVTPAQTR